MAYPTDWPFRSLRRAAAAVACLALLAGPPAGARQPDDRSLVMGGDATYVPFHFNDDEGRATGFDVALMRAVAKEQGLDVRFALGDWNDALLRLERGELDVVPMFVTPARARRFLFTEPYLVRYHTVFGPPESPHVDTLQQLSGARVAVQRAGLAFEAVQAIPEVRAVVLDEEPATLAAVANGAADYALVPTGVGYQAINDGALDVVALSPPLLEHDYAFAVRRDRPDLVARLDAGLRQVRDNGEHDALYVEWIGNLAEAAGAPSPWLWAWLAFPLALAPVLVLWRRRRGSEARPPPLVIDLRQAIADGSLDYALQPKLDLRTRAWTGAELLVRWTHPKHGPLSPAAFVPLAEQAGAIGEMTLYLVRRGLAHCRHWQREGRALVLSINVSANDLADHALVRAIIDASGAGGTCLMLEVTETDVMRDPDRVVEAIAELRSHGIRISVDDFGTGHSSLTNLRRLAPDELKIDQSFVQALLHSPSDRAIVRASIRLGHDLGARVTAEGIEDEGTLRWLRDAGCDCAQGDHIARPMPPEEFEATLPVHKAAGASAARR